MRRSGQIPGTMSTPLAQPGSPVMLRRSMSGNAMNNLAMTSTGGVHHLRRNDQSGSMMGNMGNHHSGANTSGHNAAYRASLVSHYAEDLDRRRRQEKMVEDNREIPSDNLKIESVEFFARDNAREHRTERYELVRDNTGRDGMMISPSMPMPMSSMAQSNMQLATMDHRDFRDHRDYQHPMYRNSTVLRRGQPFFMAIRMKDRNYDPRRDILRVCFNFGPTPQMTKGTRVILPFRMTQREFTRAPQKWDIRLHQQDGMNITFQVHIPANALVGLWRVNIETTTATPGARVDDFRFKDDLYIIFNPFCRDDPVYLDSEDLRREYIMNETGKVFVGTHHRPKGRRWVYGQFSDVTLPVAQLLLEQSGLSPTERGNPVQVVRAIAGIINATDGFGLLEGKWEGSFEDGICPWSWTGSSRIFEQYLRNGSKPVKYGQCWVYAAVATSLFRALGIPARPVTNFVSARDTNHTLSVDKYFDIFGEELKGGPEGNNQDALWNFHVWTETWMARPDLPHGFGGWQAVDATPHPQLLQQHSGGEMMIPRGKSCVDAFRRGPSSVEAVRRGEVGFGFDTTYLFAEVNAEVNHFQEDETSHWGFKRIHVNNYQVGRQILTKRAGADDDVADTDLEDITGMYKNAEALARHQKQGGDGCFNSLFNQGQLMSSSAGFYGDRDRDMQHYPGSAAERLSAMNSARSVDQRAQPMFEFSQKANEDVFFDLIEVDKVAYGQPFTVTLQMQNRSSEMRTIMAILSTNSVYYTGVTARRLGRVERQLVLQPGARETMQVRVSWDDYRDKIVDCGHIKIYAMASVQETKQTWSEEDEFQLEKPKLEVQIRGTPQVGQDCFVTFSFMNPISVNLTECEFTFEGPGLVRPQSIKYRDVKPGEMISYVHKFMPRMGGERKLVGIFNSRELGDVVGSRPIHVRD